MKKQPTPERIGETINEIIKGKTPKCPFCEKGEMKKSYPECYTEYKCTKCGEGVSFN